MIERKGSESSRSRRERGQATVVVCAGGGFGEAAACVDALDADLTVRIDVPNELPARDHPRVVTIALAEGHTLATLADSAGCDPKIREFLAKNPAVNPATGLCQSRVVGDMAIKVRLQDPEMNEFLYEQIYERLLTIHNGDIRSVRLVGAAGDSGGTGGPAVEPFLDALARVFHENIDPIVHVQLLRVGSLSYVGLGSRLHPNTAVTIEEDLAYVKDPTRHARQVRSVTNLELPMLGPQKALRDRHALQFLQAFRSPQVQEIIDRLEPNAAFGVSLGGVTTINPSWWHGLEDRRVAAELSASFRPLLQELLTARPPRDMVEQVWAVFPRLGFRPAYAIEEIEKIVQQSDGVMPEGFEDQCLEITGNTSRGQVFVLLADGSRVDITERLRNDLPRTHRTVEECHGRIITLKAIGRELDESIRLRTSQIARLARQSRERRKRLRRAIRRVFPQAFPDRLIHMFIDPRQAASDLKNSVLRAQEVEGRQRQTEAELAVLREARDIVQGECNAEEQVIQRAIELLASFPLGRNAVHAGPLVRPGAIDTIFSSLMDLAARDTAEPADLARLLISSVESVTLPGLARIVGAAQPRAETIAERLAHGAPPVESPPWGSKPPARPGIRITVLPPLKAEDEEELRRAILAVDPDRMVACATTTAAGVNIVGLDVFKPQYHDEVLSPFIRRNLEQADRQPELYRTSARNNGHLVNSDSTTKES
jgi:hypothetical protein